MRIILDYRPALRERTGVGEYVHELARALASGGDERPKDQIVAFSSSWKDRLDVSDIGGIEPVDARVPVRLLNFAWHRLRWPPVERLAGPAQIAHSAHPLLMPSRVAAQAITIHDLDFLEHPERTSGEIRRDYPALVHRHARQADLVVVSSHTTATEVIDRLHVAAERVVICPAGAPSWTRRDPRFGGRYFLFIGTMEPRKNVGTLLDAYTALLERLPGAPPLHLAGRTTSSAAALLRRLARPPLEGRAIHRGYVPAARKRELYSGAVATVIPSLTEGFGLNALEAMTLGVPVIASRRGSLPEVLGDAALFIDPDRPGTIAEAMWKLATDEAAARQLADAGVARAATFSWSRSAETLRQAYEEAWLRKRGRG